MIPLAHQHLLAVPAKALADRAVAPESHCPPARQRARRQILESHHLDHGWLGLGHVLTLSPGRPEAHRAAVPRPPQLAIDGAVGLTDELDDLVTAVAGRA